MIDIFFSGIGAIFYFANPGTDREFNALHTVTDERFDFVFQRIGKFIAVSIKELDTVKFYRIMGCGNHNTCIHFILSCQISNCRCRNNSYENRIRADGTSSRHQSVSQHIARYSRIAAYHDRRLVLVFFGKHISPRLPKLHR